MYRSSDTYVVQARSWLPDAVGGVIWFGPAAAHGTVYVPVLAGMQSAPDTLGYGWQGVYNTSTAFWANRRVLNLAQVKFGYMIAQIRQVQNALESASAQLVTDLSAKYNSQSTDASVQQDMSSTLESVFSANAWRATFEMNRLFHFLVFTYADGELNYWDSAGFHSSNLGYPVWWLEAGNYVDGPPPVSEGNTLTPMQLQLQEMALKRSAIESKNEAGHGRKLTSAVSTAAAGVHILSGLAVESVTAALPGLSAAATHETTTALAAAAAAVKGVKNASEATARALRDCMAQCALITDHAQYRDCAVSCVENNFNCVIQTGKPCQ